MTKYTLNLFPDGASWGMEVGNKHGYKTLTGARKAAKKALENYSNGGLAFVAIRKEDITGPVSISGLLETVNKYS